jgi:hypothetical protein
MFMAAPAFGVAFCPTSRTEIKKTNHNANTRQPDEINTPLAVVQFLNNLYLLFSNVFLIKFSQSKSYFSLTNYLSLNFKNLTALL